MNSRLHFRYFIGLMLLWMVVQTAEAQMQAQFSQNVNRYQWLLRAQNTQTGRWGSVNWRNDWQTEALVLGEKQLSWRTENQTWAAYTYPFSTQVSGLIRSKSSVFSQNKVWSQAFLGGIRYQPLPYAAIEPLAGYASDRRTGATQNDGTVLLHRDDGPAAAMNLSLQPPVGQEWKVNLIGMGDVQWLNPRMGHMVAVRSDLQRVSGNSGLQMQIKAANLRREIYQSASFINPLPELNGELIESTFSDTLETVLQFQTPLHPHVLLTGTSDFSANRRRIRNRNTPNQTLYFDTDLNRQRLNGEIGLLFNPKPFNLRMTARWGAESENRRLTNAAALPANQAALKSDLLRKTDYDRGSFALNGLLQMPLTRHWALDALVSAHILRHDTPEANPDDRDEVFQNGNIRLNWTPDEKLQVGFQLLGTFYHTVYLKAERSAENNIQRGLQWRSIVLWRPDERTRFQFVPEIRATYTVDDFVISGRLPNDQSARELSYEASLEHRVEQDVRFLLDGSYSDLQLGRLLWTDFAEIPFDTIRTVGAWARVRVGSSWTAETGVKLFFRSDYNRNTILRYPKTDENGQTVTDTKGNIVWNSVSGTGRDLTRQLGPTFALVYPLGGGSELRSDGWVQVQRMRQRLHAALPDDPVIHHAARFGTMRIIPNLSITLLWKW